jgi:hypothetical protein
MAIAGIVKHLGTKLMDSSYVLRLFWHDLSGQLTWWPFSERLRLRNEYIAYPKRDVIYASPSISAMPSVLPANQRFPSFSWASVDFHFLPGDSHRLGNFIIATPASNIGTTKTKAPRYRPVKMFSTSYLVQQSR